MVTRYTSYERKRVFWGYIVFYLALQIVISFLVGAYFDRVLNIVPTLEQINGFLPYIAFITSLATFLWYMHVTKSNMRDNVIHLRNNKGLAIWILIGFIMMYAFSVVTGALYFEFGINGTSENQIILESMIADNPWVMVFPIAILIPVVEEILFRGAALEAIEKRFGTTFSVIAVNTVFAFMHVSDAESVIFFPIYFGLGLMLTWLYFKSNRNILIPIGAHVLNNTLTVIFMLLLV